MSGIVGLKGALGGALVAALLASTGAFAQERTGVLQCKLMGSDVSVLIENQAVDCVYRDDHGAPEERYTGKLTKVGANISVNGPGEFGWAVATTSRLLAPGALAGQYAGPGVTAKLGVGGGGAILVGGSDNTISLQPFTAEAGTGLGITAGVQNLALAYVPPPPPPRVHSHRHRHGKKWHAHPHHGAHHH
jgi:hypothetical protein